MLLAEQVATLRQTRSRGLCFGFWASEVLGFCKIGQDPAALFYFLAMLDVEGLACDHHMDED